MRVTPGTAGGSPRTINFFQDAAISFFTFFSGSVEVLWRHNFGERYFRGQSLTISGGLLLIGLVFLNTARLGFGNPLGMIGGGGFLSVLFVLAFLIAGVIHRYRIFRRNWYTGPEWHSFASGNSWIHTFTSGLRRGMGRTVPVDDATQRYIEPGLTVMLGLLLLITRIDTFLGVWLLVAGWALFNKEGIQADILRHEYLDRVDKQIETDARVSLLADGWAEGVTDDATKSLEYRGFRASVPLATRTPEQRQNAVTTLEALFPDEMQKARNLQAKAA